MGCLVCHCFKPWHESGTRSLTIAARFDFAAWLRRLELRRAAPL